MRIGPQSIGDARKQPLSSYEYRQRGERIVETIGVNELADMVDVEYYPRSEAVDKRITNGKSGDELIEIESVANVGVFIRWHNGKDNELYPVDSESQVLLPVVWQQENVDSVQNSYRIPVDEVDDWLARMSNQGMSLVEAVEASMSKSDTVLCSLGNYNEEYANRMGWYDNWCGGLSIFKGVAIEYNYRKPPTASVSQTLTRTLSHDGEFLLLHDDGSKREQYPVGQSGEERFVILPVVSTGPLGSEYDGYPVSLERIDPLLNTIFRNESVGTLPETLLFLSENEDEISDGKKKALSFRLFIPDGTEIVELAGWDTETTYETIRVNWGVAQNR